MNRKLFAGVVGLTFAGLTFVGLAGPANATLITNGDFETGDLTGWTSFLTVNGKTNASGVTSFDTDGDTTATFSAQLSVGQAVFSGFGGDQAGAGISQSFNVSSGGTFSVSLDIASDNTSAAFTNGAGGLFSVSVDGVLLDSVDFGGITFGTTERDTLSANFTLASGAHLLELVVTRAFLIPSTLFQYLDNVVLTATPAVAIPEPTAWTFFAIGLAGIGFFTRRRRKAA